MEIGNWFKGFEKGLERLSPEQRSAFLSECGRNCVNGGTLSVYQQLYERAQGDMDTFFQMANELSGVREDEFIALFSWNAPVSCAKKDMSPLHCSASVHAKV